MLGSVKKMVPCTLYCERPAALTIRKNHADENNHEDRKNDDDKKYDGVVWPVIRTSLPNSVGSCWYIWET